MVIGACCKSRRSAHARGARTRALAAQGLPQRTVLSMLVTAHNSSPLNAARSQAPPLCSRAGARGGGIPHSSPRLTPPRASSLVPPRCAGARGVGVPQLLPAPMRAANGAPGRSEIAPGPASAMSPRAVSGSGPTPCACSVALQHWLTITITITGPDGRLDVLLHSGTSTSAVVSRGAQ